MDGNRSTNNRKYVMVKVEVLGETYQVINGKAEIIFDDAFLYSSFSETNDKEQVRVILDITVYKEGFPEAKDRVEFILDTPLSPLTMIHPATDEVFIEEETCRIVFSVEPGSQVFINDNITATVTAKDCLRKNSRCPIIRKHI